MKWIAPIVAAVFIVTVWSMGYLYGKESGKQSERHHINATNCWWLAVDQHNHLDPIPVPCEIADDCPRGPVLARVDDRLQLIIVDARKRVCVRPLY